MGMDSRIYFLMTRLLGEGRFDDVIEQLPRLQSLGVNVLWISPPHPQKTFTEANPHGYWPSSHWDIDDKMGGEAKFTELVRTARAHGVRICVDLVLNHFGYGESFRMGEREVSKDDVRFFKPSKDSEGPIHPREEQLWAKLEDDRDPTALRRYHRELSRIPLFHLPSLEHDSAEVREYLAAAVRRFIDWGVDYFRVDAVKHMSFEFLHPFTEEMIRYGRTRGKTIHFLWELSIAKSHGLDVFVKDTLARISDSRAVTVLDFPLFYILRDLRFGALADLLEERAIERHAVKHFVPMIESHDMAPPLGSVFARRVAYSLGEFVSFHPVVIHHGTEIAEACGTGRDPIDAIDPAGEIGEIRNVMSDALLDYRDAPALAQFRTIHQTDDLLVLSRAIGGRTAYFAVNKGVSVETPNFLSRLGRGSLLRHYAIGNASVATVEGPKLRQVSLHLPPQSILFFELVEDRFESYANGVERHLVPMAVERGGSGTMPARRLSITDLHALAPEGSVGTVAGRKLDLKVCDEREMARTERALGRKGMWQIFLPSGNFGKIPSGHTLVMIGGMVYSRNVGTMGGLSITSAPFADLARHEFMRDLFRRKFYLAQFFELSDAAASDVAGYFRRRETDCRESDGRVIAEYCSRPLTSLRGGEQTENCTTFAFPWQLPRVSEELGEMRFSELPALQLAFNSESQAYRGTLFVTERTDYFRRRLAKDGLREDVEGRQLLFKSAMRDYAGACAGGEDDDEGDVICVDQYRCPSGGNVSMGSKYS